MLMCLKDTEDSCPEVEAMMKNSTDSFQAVMSQMGLKAATYDSLKMFATTHCPTFPTGKFQYRISCHVMFDIRNDINDPKCFILSTASIRAANKGLSYIVIICTWLNNEVRHVVTDHVCAAIEHHNTCSLWHENGGLSLV